jgi:hypothetical protein
MSKNKQIEVAAKGRKLLLQPLLITKFCIDPKKYVWENYFVSVNKKYTGGTEFE